MFTNVLLWLETAVIALGLWGVLILIIFAFFHPSLEFPAAIFMFVIMIGLTQSLFLSFFLLMFAHTVGSAFTYYVFHHVPSFQLRRPKMVLLLQKAKDWYDNKSEWQHILVMSLPLVYTYPLRVYWTRKQSSFFMYMSKMVVMYSLLYLWNLLLYQFIQDIFRESPSVLLSIFFVGFAIIIYRIRKFF